MKESDWMWNQLNNLQNQHRSTVGLSVFLLYSLNLSENEISWTFHSINCDTDWRRTVMLIGTDNGVQGDHDSVLSILAEVLAGRVLLHHGEEAESCGVCSYVLLDSIFCYLLMLSSIFHVSCAHSDSRGTSHLCFICGRYFLQQQNGQNWVMVSWHSIISPNQPHCPSSVSVTVDAVNCSADFIFT